MNIHISLIPYLHTISLYNCFTLAVSEVDIISSIIKSIDFTAVVFKEKVNCVGPVII